MISLLAVTTVICGSYAASAETLQDALAAAYESNPQLLAQRAALRATDENVSTAKSAFLPNLSGTYTHTRDHSSLTGPSQQQDGSIAITTQGANSRSDDYSITARQNIFNGFQDRNAVKSAKSGIMAGRAQLLSVEQQVLLQAVTAYMNVVRDEAVVKLNENNVQVLERQLQASKDRFRVGEITRTDVAQSEARLESAKSALLSAKATLASSRALYRRVVGRTPAGLDTPSKKPELPVNLDAAVEQAMELSPGVIAAKYNEEAARYNVSKAKGALLPSLNAQASERYTSNNGGLSQYGAYAGRDLETQSVTVQLSVPLYSGGQRYSTIRKAKQIRSQRMMEIHQAERVAQETVFTAWDNYRAAVGQIASTEAAVHANEIALEGVRQEAAVGSRTTLDVLNAEQELLNSRVSLVRAQRDEFVAAYSLVSATGRLTATNLGLNVEKYDDEAYYNKVKNKFIGFGTGDK
ncbi:TolC family outer membrane protein [Kordiimonas marina]|uniref:TolC family outer membrane protein n=1 Tax=Kordiimonas marina TaxID=2872312 RepID=UPI001FF2640E|nr:TolC family outer membrane protein [Kordiimonas marina]MCJ9430236.1 TolC family outer membrane protein [Kordiimonas marina]